MKSWHWIVVSFFFLASSQALAGNEACDLNNDGQVNVQDVQLGIEHTKNNTCPYGKVCNPHKIQEVALGKGQCPKANNPCTNTNQIFHRQRHYSASHNCTYLTRDECCDRAVWQLDSNADIGSEQWCRQQCGGSSCPSHATYSVVSGTYDLTDSYGSYTAEADYHERCECN